MELRNLGVGNLPTETVIYIREDGIALYWEQIRGAIPWVLYTIVPYFAVTVCACVLACLILKKNSQKNR